jgi:hypothetical protein
MTVLIKRVNKREQMEAMLAKKYMPYIIGMILLYAERRKLCIK